MELRSGCGADVDDPAQKIREYAIGAHVAGERHVGVVEQIPGILAGAELVIANWFFAVVVGLLDADVAVVGYAEGGGGAELDALRAGGVTRGTNDDGSSVGHQMAL